MVPTTRKLKLYLPYYSADYDVDNGDVDVG